jgi:putative flippase GtrA
LRLRTLVARYSAFAALATGANLITQRAILQAGDTTWIFLLAMAAGTLVGLALKFVLDKRWIFRDRESGLKANGRKFSLYTVAGGVTTLIFWGMESAFWMIGRTDAMRETGAVIGLAIGYFVKYNLDKRYVFSNPLLRVPS